MSSPETTTLFDTTAVSAAVKAMPGAKPQAPRPLSPAAQDVVAEDFKQAYSPIVLAGAVRAIEVVLVAVVGLILYLCYVVPDNGFSRYLFRRHRRHLADRTAGVSGGRHLPGSGVSRPRKAIYAARVGVVGRVPARDCRVVLRQSRRSILPRLARQLLRGRADRAARVSPRAVSPGATLDSRKAVSTAAPSSSAPARAAKR